MFRPIVLVWLVGIGLVGCGSDEPPASTAAAAATPLPPTALRVRWGTLAFPPTVDAGTTVPITVSFTNAGDAAWPDKATADPQKKDGSYAVRLTHTWVRADEVRNDHAGAQRTDLPRPLAPGESIDLRVDVRTPAAPGEYRLVIELVQELVRWFADAGAERLTIPVRVVPAGAPGDTASSR